MAKVTLQGNDIRLSGEMPQVGTTATDICGVKTDLSPMALSQLQGKRVVMNIFPSVDTGVCAASVRRFNKEAAALDNTVVLCISKDLPFAQARFCGAEGLENVVMLSEFNTNCMEQYYGLGIVEGPMTGLLARAVIILDENRKVVYTELVPEITQEPNYEAALAALK